MRAALLLLVSLALPACANRVQSTSPWFTAADAQGAPSLRSGLWAIWVDGECRFDARKPLEQWSGCAKGVVFREGEKLELSTSAPEETGLAEVSYTWTSEPYLLASGALRIYQGPCVPGLVRKREEAPAADATAAPEAPAETAEPVEPEPEVASEPAADEPAAEEDPKPFCYFAVRPVASDPQGRIVAAETWPVSCGPLPAGRKKKAANATETPYPGLVMDEDNCTANSVAALRAAAAKSETVTGVMKARWVRDGYH